MIRIPQLLVALAAVVLLVAPSTAGARSNAAPTGLRGFMLRYDEPKTNTFPRTPSFGWSPVRGALRYEFQLSTSNSFRENGIIYSLTSLTTPVVAPDLTLPWITGEPHALYARVRAVTEDTTTPWSAAFGFDMEPAKVAAPLPSQPGLIRWTPVDGATEYEVWFVDIPKIIRTPTNVADEREFYSFHQAASWLGQVRWRVRAVRLDFNARANGLPASKAGPWSAVYTSVNPPFATGALQPVATVSDVVTTGASGGGDAHRLMPAFAYTGNQGFTGGAGELYRVQVFTDRKCINRVYTGAVVGSPAYAPRDTGPLALPASDLGIGSARNAYLPDGKEGSTYFADGETAEPNEGLAGVEPTTSLPAGKPVTPVTTTPSTGDAKEQDKAKTSEPESKPAAEPAKAATVQLLKAKGPFGPPIDIWDTDWANGGGYYWTVIPVTAVVSGASTTAVNVSVALGATSLPVANSSGFATGDTISIGAGGTVETAKITGVAAGTLTLGAPLEFGHGSGESVTRTNGKIEYRDAELAQDVCASGRVMRFGKESEPVLTSGGEPFSTGLTNGKTASADDDATFYGAPLVSWTPALGSSVYAVQWSRTRGPFKPETDPATGALGMMTVNTSVVLPLEPGTWWYRVRGYSFSLPSGSQALSWSDPEKVVAAKPSFTIVAGDEAEDGKELRVPAGGFSIRLPKSWTYGARGAQSRSTAAKLFPLGTGPLKLAALHEEAALFVQSAPSIVDATTSDWAKSTVAAYKRMQGRKGAVSCSNVSLPAGAGVRCALTAKIGKTTEAAVVYVLQHRGAAYTLTFASAPAAIGATRAAFTEIARSLRFTS